MPRSQKLPASETVRRLATIEGRIRRLERERARLVQAARAESESWQTIAAALGVSRQAAWQAHREGAVVVARIRSGSGLSDEEAMAVARAAIREVRRDPPGRRGQVGPVGEAVRGDDPGGRGPVPPLSR